MVIEFYNGVNKLAECSIRVTVLLEYLDLHLLHRVGFRIITQWFVIQLFYTTARTFYEDYSSYTPIFSSLLLAVCLIGVKTNTFLLLKINRVIVTQVGFCVISPWS